MTGETANTRSLSPHTPERDTQTVTGETSYTRSLRPHTLEGDTQTVAGEKEDNNDETNMMKFTNNAEAALGSALWLKVSARRVVSLFSDPLHYQLICVPQRSILLASTSIRYGC